MGHGKVGSGRLGKFEQAEIGSLEWKEEKKERTSWNLTESWLVKKRYDRRVLVKIQTYLDTNKWRKMFVS
jgi:hypothetical protein